MDRLAYVPATDGQLVDANDILCDLLVGLVRNAVIEKHYVGDAKVWRVINDNQVLRGKEPV